MTAVLDERTNDMPRGLPVRIDGKTRTIPHDQIARYEALSAQVAELYAGDEHAHERDAALRAAALYLVDPPTPVSVPLPRTNGKLTADDEARHAAILQRLAPVGDELQAGREAEQAARAAARAVAVLSEADGASELGASRALGVDRLQVRKWRGKQDR
ncbi:helix-turn-helix DNA binding domain protein [Mycobacterium phage MalagasyRose]|uniref:Helix-turn-helix DNA binding domain protein n=1 Tax=Mycobacterium phage MalagasyRose TaxID=2599870 RepID=A0A5J6TEN8_9CAUD|nr:helix-turn-helix DNA binding domain protein [Mycobacterium phage MalagasyRose]QFG08888.1 helix-turn-helix DNA binding domain protein [Mycobacterium phage MalagasyRose]